MDQKRKTSLLSVNCPVEEKTQLAEMAKQEQRTVSNMVLVLLREAVAQRNERQAA